MRLQGDPLLPYTNGAVDLTKPPVYAWLAAASFRAFGESEAAARLPSVLATLGSLALAFAVGRRVAGTRAGWLAAFACLTQARFLWQARLAEIESVLLLAVAAAYAALLRLLETPPGRERGWAGAAFFVAVAAGLATKGPVVFLLTVPAAVAAALATGRGRVLLSRAFLLAAPLSLLGLSWYVAAVLRDRSSLDTFLSYARGENVGHLRDALYYLWQWPLNALPWTPFAVAGLALAAKDRLAPAPRRLVRALAAVFGATFLTMTVVPAKQTHYLMPVFWTGGVLAGVALDRLLAGATLRARRAAAAAAVALVAVLLFGVGWAVPAQDDRRSARDFFETVGIVTDDGPLAWTVFASHSDYLWYLGAERVGRTGVPELVGATPEGTIENVRAWLARPGPRYAVVTGPQADALGSAARVLLRDDRVGSKRRSYALVTATRGAP
jgi:4-amino-4-deoxy-L-arabinose transferase-like glycosyltransferase